MCMVCTDLIVQYYVKSTFKSNSTFITFIKTKIKIRNNLPQAQSVFCKSVANL